VNQIVEIKDYKQEKSRTARRIKCMANQLTSIRDRMVLIGHLPEIQILDIQIQVAVHALVRHGKETL